MSAAGDVRIIGVDVGGTFTDVVAVQGGEVLVAKVPTDAHSSDASVLAGAAEVGAGAADVFNLASTAGLNSVITRRLPKVAFLTTLGHRDVLDQGSLGRPIEALSDPTWQRNFGDASGRPLVPRYLRRGVLERLMASGEVLIELDEAQAREELRVLRRCEVRGVAICLINSYVDGRHERRLRELVHEELGPQVAVSLSSEATPQAKEYFRASTTVVDVLMKLLYGEYTRRLQAGLAKQGFKGQFNYADCRAMMLSVDYAMERPYQMVLGGPAGGTMASAHFGTVIGDGKLICADIGGTSCDISLVVEHEPWFSATFELEHDLVVNAVSTNVVTLGAGGGSVIWVTPSGEIAAGPDSAGAEPGPACYGAGGTRPTITDAALLIGILQPEHFLGGKKRLHKEPAQQAFEALQTHLPLDRRVRFAWEMALNNMAEGLVDIAVRRGIDTREFSLVAFGAAGPMTLPCLLDLLPLRRVIVPPHPGLFSALGLASADRVYSDHCCKYTILSPAFAEELDRRITEMETRLLARLSEAERRVARTQRSFDACLMGQSWLTPFVEIPAGPITAGTIGQMIANFHRLYEKLNQTRFDALPVQSVIYRVQVVVPSEKVRYAQARRRSAALGAGSITLRHLYGADVSARVFERGDLGLGDVIDGPAVIREAMSTTFVPRGRSACVGSVGELVIE
jgi:N-methylhydantoinase A